MTRQDKTKKGPGEGVWQSAQYRRHSGGARLQTGIGRDYSYRLPDMGVGVRLAFGEGALELKVYARVLGTALVNWPQNERALLPDDTSVRLMPPVDPHVQNTCRRFHVLTVSVAPFLAAKIEAPVLTSAVI